jgi:uncharacterized OsmC-like protein
MNLHLAARQELHLSLMDADEFHFSQESPALYFGAMPLFVASLGRCTFAVLSDYSHRLEIPTHNIVMRLTWEYAENPTRIRAINMQITWPELPEKRHKAVQRAAHLCTIHNTISSCVEITTGISS